MTRWLVGLFLIAHGLIHPAVHAIRPDPVKPPPFDARHSWILSAAGVADVRSAAVGVWWSLLTAALFVVAGLAVLIDAPWVTAASAGAIAGVLLETAYFHPWLSFGVALNVGILWAVFSEWPPSLF